MKITITILQILLGIFVGFGANGQTWTALPAITGNNASNTKIAIDKTSGEIYVAYTEAFNSDKISVRKYSGSNWSTVGAIAFSAGAASNVNLAISSTGIPYVAYRDAVNNNKATVMKFNGTSWVLVGVAGFSNSGTTNMSLAVHNNTPLLVYEADGPPPFTANRATYAQEFNGSTWVNIGSTMGVPGLVDQGSAPSLAFDTSGVAHVVYLTGSACSVMKYNGFSWGIVGGSAIVSNGAQIPNIAFDNITNTPYVAFRNGSDFYKATLYKLNGSNWTQVGTGFSAGYVDYVKVVIRNSTPYVVYSDNGVSSSNGDKTTVMSYNGSSWVSVGPVAFTNGQAFHQSIASYGNKLYVGHITNSTTAEVVEYNLNTSITQIPNQFTNFTLAPNPVSDILTINTSETIDALTVLSIDSKVIKSTTTSFISVSELPQGIYLLQVTTPKGVGVERFIKE